MSNACKNSLLIIVAVIVCVATPLLGSKVFAQSELFFPVARSVSYTAPSLESVFEKTPAPTTVVQDVSITVPSTEVIFTGHPQRTVSTKQSNKVVTNLTIASETTVYIEVPAEETFIVKSELRFPVTSKVSYTAPDLENVFSGYTQNTDTVVTRVTSYIVPDLEVVFTGHPHDDTSVVTQTVFKDYSSKKTVDQRTVKNKKTTDKNGRVSAKKRNKIARKIANLYEQVAELQQRIASLKGSTVKEDHTPVQKQDNITDLRKQVAELQQRVASLKKESPAEKGRASTRKQKKIERKIANLYEQVAVLQQRIALLQESPDTEGHTSVHKQSRIADLHEQVAVLQQRVAFLKESAANDFGCGVCGPMVKNLQKFLNRNGFTLATVGAGSPGQETSYFGPRTRTALERFQAAYNIPVTGVADTQTRNRINSIESNALGKITAIDCVLPKNTVATGNGSNKEIVGEIIQSDQNEKDDDKSTSGNFFTNLFRKIINFFKTLFGLN